MVWCRSRLGDPSPPFDSPYPSPLESDLPGKGGASDADGDGRVGADPKAAEELTLFGFALENGLRVVVEFELDRRGGAGAGARLRDGGTRRLAIACRLT